MNRTVDAGTNQRADTVRPRDAREPLVEDAGGDAFRDMQRRIENVVMRRVNQAHRQVLLGDLLGDACTATMNMSSVTAILKSNLMAIQQCST